MDEQAPSGSAPKPHYHGHRQRLRERFVASGPDSLADYELLELMLFSAIPRVDVKPLAKTLIEKFGGFAGVLHADVAALAAVPGLSENSAILLKAVEYCHPGRSCSITARPAWRIRRSNPSACCSSIARTR
jgi:DNA repair protein RadC